MSTPDNHIEAMQSLAEKIQEHPYIKSAHIDDWGRFSNFTLIIAANEWTRGTTNILKGIVRRALEETPAHLRDVFPPEFTGFNHMGDRMYHANFWKFDIDYHEYIPDVNVFVSEDSQILSDATD